MQPSSDRSSSYYLILESNTFRIYYSFFYFALFPDHARRISGLKDRELIWDLVYILPGTYNIIKIYFLKYNPLAKLSRIFRYRRHVI